MSNILGPVLAGVGKVPGVSLSAIAVKLPDIIHAVVALLGALVVLLTAVLPVVPENWKAGAEAAIAALTAASVWLAGKTVTSLVALLEKVTGTATSTTSG